MQPEAPAPLRQAQRYRQAQLDIEPLRFLRSPSWRLAPHQRVAAAELCAGLQAAVKGATVWEGSTVELTKTPPPPASAAVAQAGAGC